MGPDPVSLYDDLEEEKALLVGCMDALETYVEEFNVDTRLVFPTLVVEIYALKQWVPVARLQVRTEPRDVMIIAQDDNGTDGFQCDTWESFFEVSVLGRNTLLASMVTTKLA